MLAACTSVAVVALAVVAALGGYAMTAVRDQYGVLLGAIAPLGIDEYTGGPASAARQFQVVATEHMTGAATFSLEKALAETVALEWTESPHVDGLRTTRALTDAKSTRKMADVDGSKALVVGTIRMGFGHHRIAYAMSSWGAAAKKQKFPEGVYFHDLLSIESDEARLIHETDAMYRKSSKLATEIGGPFELLHGFVTSSGDATSLRSTALIGARLSPLLRGLPKGVPLVATHTLVALAAAIAGTSDTIINLVIDNHPQWFVVSPGAKNLVQGPRNYFGFLHKFAEGDAPTRFSDDLHLAGHWIPKDMVDDAAKDADRRIRRARLPASKAPRRVLVPVGGAGAQKKFITELVVAAAPACHRGELQLVLNAGDHADMKASLLATLDGLGFSGGDLAVVGTYAAAATLAASFKKSDAGGAKVTLMAFEDYFAAVAATDLLVPAVDVLACKPSELAFYPVPKLMIRRVGDHEAFSASRANELGDGTAEARTVEDALTYLALFVKNAEPLVTMNTMIKHHVASGAYGGCKYALDLAAP